MREALQHVRSNAVAYLALFVALGGSGAYAADKLGSKDIAKNAIKSKHVAPDALSGTDINESGLGQVQTAVKASGVDPASLTVRTAPGVVFSIGQTDDATATCSTGQRAIGGGAQWLGGNDDHGPLTGSAPTSSGTGWRSSMMLTSGFAANFTAYAVCIDTP